MKKHKLIRNVGLHQLGVERTYKPRTLISHPGWNFSDMLTLAVGYHLASHSEFTFLQIGAFDGVNNDPLHALILKYKLSGILVEPQPKAFDALKVTYRDHPQLILVQAAVSHRAEVKPFYTSEHQATQVASFSREHLIKRKVPPSAIKELQLQCFTIDSLLKKYAVDSLDLIQIDTEGYDFEIIKSIDFSSTKPFIIRYEHEHLSNLDYNASLELLAQQGYQFHVEKKDVTAIRWLSESEHQA